MMGRGRDQHQPEPWGYEGRSILNASGWTLAKTIFEAELSQRQTPALSI